MLIKLEAMKGKGKKGTGRGAGRITEVVLQTKAVGQTQEVKEQGVYLHR